MNGFENVPGEAKPSQGGMAMRSGIAIRAMLNGLFQEVGLLFTRANTLASITNDQATFHGRGCYGTNVLVGKCEYGRDLELPFVIRPNSWNVPLGIELQNQDVTGSADEKLVKAMLDLMLAPIHSVMVLTGAHMTSDSGIIAFAMRAVANSRGKILCVFIGDHEFVRWINEGMQWPGDSQTQLGSLVNGGAS